MVGLGSDQGEKWLKPEWEAFQGRLSGHPWAVEDDPRANLIYAGDVEAQLHIRWGCGRKLPKPRALLYFLLQNTFGLTRRGLRGRRINIIQRVAVRASPECRVNLGGAHIVP